MLLHRHRLLREQAKAANQAAREALAAEHARRSEAAENREAIFATARGENLRVDDDGFSTKEDIDAMHTATLEALRIMSEAELREQAARLGIEIDGRWGVGRIRREVAHELGHEL